VRNNPDRKKQLDREWQFKNPERRREIARNYAARNRKANPQKVNAVNRKRRAQKRRAVGSHTADQWMALCEWFGGVCLKCGAAGHLTVDHVIPLNPGSDSIENLQPLCLSCNSSKQRNVIDYRDSERLRLFLDRYVRSGTLFEDNASSRIRI
jgi:5-methylcytosine-specific restriction endonuclease McrA